MIIVDHGPGMFATAEQRDGYDVSLEITDHTDESYESPSTVAIITASAFSTEWGDLFVAVELTLDEVLTLMEKLSEVGLYHATKGRE